MPIDIKYLDKGTGVLHVGRGTLTGKEILEAKLATFGSEERTKRYQYGLIDYSQVDDVLISSQELATVVGYDKRAAKIAPGIPVVIVGEKDIVFGLARMWEAFMLDAGWETHVFRSREQSEDWIRARVRNKYGVEPTFT
jgi:hypothetical protein